MRKLEAESHHDKSSYSYKAKVRMIDKPTSELAANRVRSFNPAYFEISEYFDHIWNVFELYSSKECDHFIDEGPNSFGDAMRSV